MAGYVLTAAVDPNGELAGYLARLDRTLLGGSRRVRGEILDEITDALLTAAERKRERGATPAAAVRTALAEIGPAQVIAAAFAGELAVARARRLLAALLLTGPAVGVWWLLLLAPRPWPPPPGELVAAIPVLPVVAATVAVGVAFLGATGRLAHRLPACGPHSTVRIGRVAAVTCLAVDVTMLGRLVVLATTPAGHPAPVMAVAALASLARLLCVGVALGRHRHSAIG